MSYYFKLNLLTNNLDEIRIIHNNEVRNENINYLTNKIKKIRVLNCKKILKNLPNSVKFIVFEFFREKKMLNKYTPRIKVE